MLNSVSMVMHTSIGWRALTATIGPLVAGEDMPQPITARRIIRCPVYLGKLHHYLYTCQVIQRIAAPPDELIAFDVPQKSGADGRCIYIRSTVQRNGAGGCVSWA